MLVKALANRFIRKAKARHEEQLKDHRTSRDVQYIDPDMLPWVKHLKGVCNYQFPAWAEWQVIGEEVVEVVPGSHCFCSEMTITPAVSAFDINIMAHTAAHVNGNMNRSMTLCMYALAEMGCTHVYWHSRMESMSTRVLSEISFSVGCVFIMFGGNKLE